MARFLPLISLKPLVVALAVVAWLQACSPEDPASMQTGLSDDSIVTQNEKEKTESSIIPGQYIVFLKEGSLSKPVLKSRVAEKPQDRTVENLPSFKLKLEAQQETMKLEMSHVLKSHNISVSSIQKVYSTLTPGASLQLEETEAASLARDERVLMIEPDMAFTLDVSTYIKTPLMPSDMGKGGEQTSYGVTRVGGSGDMWNSGYKNSRWAWIIDTGIDLDHEDLDVATSYGVNIMTGGSANDRNGHGTHVAGIVAAKDNGIGITGVAAGATVVPVKVINLYGEGKYSDVIDGLNYAAYYSLPDDVINMSIGGPANSALDYAVENAARYVKVVIAAGNNGSHISYFSPARVNAPNVYTVAAIEPDDNVSYYSNYGYNVDFAAPGSGIISTYKDNTYGILSGTSMAAPHVTGVFLMVGNYYRYKGSSRNGIVNYSIIGHR